MWEKIKANMCYLIVAILGMIFIATGGVFWTYLVGKIIMCFGILLSIASIFMSLNNKTLFWEDN